jgi:hypothetical protein
VLRVCRALLENSPTATAVHFTADSEPDDVDADIGALPCDEPHPPEY